MSLHSDRIASLNQRSSRRGTPGGHSLSAIQTSNIMPAMPGAPRRLAAYKTVGLRPPIKKVRNSCPRHDSDRPTGNCHTAFGGPPNERVCSCTARLFWPFSDVGVVRAVGFGIEFRIPHNLYCGRLPIAQRSESSGRTRWLGSQELWDGEGRRDGAADDILDNGIDPCSRYESNH